MSNLHNEFKYGVQLLRAFRLGTGMGEGDGVVRLGETLTPIVNFEDHPEWRTLGDEHLGWGFGQSAIGGAGVRSQVALVMPSGCGVAAIVEGLVSDTANWQVAVLAPAPISGVGGWTTSALQGQRDLRDLPSALKGRVMENHTVAASGVTVVGVLAIAHLWPWAAVLGPNESLIIRGPTDNVAFNGSIIWRERRLLPGEPLANG